MAALEYYPVTIENVSLSNVGFIIFLKYAGDERVLRGDDRVRGGGGHSLTMFGDENALSALRVSTMSGARSTSRA